MACATNLGTSSGRNASTASAETSVTTNEDSISLNAKNVTEISITAFQRKNFAADFLPEFNPETQIGISRVCQESTAGMPSKSRDEEEI